MQDPAPVWLLLIAVLAPVIAGVVTLWLPRRVITPRVLITLAGPAVSFLCVAIHLLGYGVSTAGTSTIPWFPSLNINLAFLADGLGGFFALLVSGIGSLIVLYARGYFGPEPDDLYRFYPTLGFFTTAMMGVVLSDYTLGTLLFWEMTSISSFLLIGWDRYDKHAVKLAMQAFFTTGLGGLGLLGGILLFGLETGVWRWSEFLHGGFEVTTPVVWALVLMFIGAGTKSAQYPFHYWLPGAMAAPTPVSAFLHSATMVKAGVFLVGRLLPVLGIGVASSHGGEGSVGIWAGLIVPFGMVTMLYGAITAVKQHDLKRIFAYTTVSQLGLLMAMYGFGGLEYHHAPNIDWDITQIANHAFYKAPLFIVAGALGHVASRNITELRGAIREHKGMVITLLLAGYALAAGPGTISFQAKELFLYAVYHSYEAIGSWWMVLMAMTVLTAICNVAIFVRLLTTLLDLPGAMKPTEPEEHAHEDAHAHHEHHHEHGLWGAMIWIPGLIIVSLQYIGGLFPGLWNLAFVPLETQANYFNAIPWLWQLSFGVPLMMSLLAIVGGVLFGLSPAMRRPFVDIHDRIYPAMYWLAVTGGGRCFRVIQTGNLRHYIVMVLVAFLVAFVAAVFLDSAMIPAAAGELGTFGQYVPGILLGIIVCATAVAIPGVRQRVVRVLLLGACGFSVVGMYLIYQAPDLALTQLMFEIISVILFVLVLRLLPDEDLARPRMPRIGRAAIASLVGLAMGWLTILAATADRPDDQQLLGEWFAQSSYSGEQTMESGRGGGGDNIVNVILVDFRSFDTLGEITVLGIAAIGVWSMLPGRWKRPWPSEAESEAADPSPEKPEPNPGNTSHLTSDAPRDPPGEGGVA